MRRCQITNVVALIVGLVIFSQLSGSGASRVDAIANAAGQVGNVAQNAGNAAQDAADDVKR